MKILTSLLAQLRSICPAIIFILTVSVFFISVVVFLNMWKGIPTGHLTRDPASVTNTPFYIGLLSNVGIFFWSAATTVCLFGAMLISKQSDRSTLRRFLYLSGLLTLFLGFDDAFLFHEEIAPVYLGVPDHLVFAGYAVFALIYLIGFYAVIFKTDYLLLGTALFFFVVSLILDLDMVPRSDMDLQLLEDGAKFIGTVSWMVYFARVVESALHRQATYR